MGNSIGEPIVDGEGYNNVLKHDVMMKRAQGRNSKHVKNYRDRLFILTSKALLYYDGSTLEMRGDLKGIVILRNVTRIVPVVETVLKKQNCFVIEHVGLSLFIVAKSEEQRNAWLEAIQLELDKLAPKDFNPTIVPKKLSVVAEDASSHIWIKKYESFEASHPSPQKRTIFQRFDLSTKISDTFLPSFQLGTNLALLELKVISKIFSFLSIRDLSNIRLVCHQWKQLAESNEMWEGPIAVKMDTTTLTNLCRQYSEVIRRLELKSIKGDVTPALFSVSNLTYLHLEYLTVDMSVLPKILPSLKGLKIRFCKFLSSNFSKQSEQKFDQLTNLTFHFRDTFSHQQLSHLLSACPGILKLDISGSLLFKSDVFRSTPSLQELRLEYVKVDASQLAIFCPNLTKLAFVWSDFVGPSKGTFARLTALNITYQNVSVYETLLKILRSVPQLLVLSLTGLLDMSVSMFNRLVPYFQHVTTLILKRCSLLNNHCMTQLSNYCHMLEYLDISDIGDITSDGVLALLLSASNLKFLDMSCTKVDNEALKVLVKRAPKLEKLGISACPNIQDESLQILSKLAHLKHLDVSECRLLTPQGIYFFSHHPKIQSINALKCQNIEKQEIILNQFSPHCHILY